MASNSSVQHLGFRQKIREWSQFFMMRFRGVWSREDFGWLWTNIAEYEAGVAKHVGKRLTESTVLEIGYGARPYRLLSLLSMGAMLRGFYLDAPLLRGRPSEFATIFRQNGFERLVKSFVRFFCFDWKQRSDSSSRTSRQRFQSPVTEHSGAEFIVEDIGALSSNAKIAEGSLDFIYSEDVFEHIPAETLSLVVTNLANWMRADGVAFIRPR